LLTPTHSFGNFVNRALKFVVSQYGGILPEGPDTPGSVSPNDDVDADFVCDVNALIKEYTDAMELVKLRLGLQTVMLLSSRGNLYLQSSGLGKALMEQNPARCAQVLSRAVNLIYVLSALIEPFMPETATAVLQQLNAPARAVPDVFAIDILSGHKLGEPTHLFKRIDEKQSDAWRAKFGGSSPSGEPNADATPLRKRKKPRQRRLRRLRTSQRASRLLRWNKKYLTKETLSGS
jgi:methionyl-tRNA synthetase